MLWRVASKRKIPFFKVYLERSSATLLEIGQWYLLLFLSYLHYYTGRSTGLSRAVISILQSFSELMNTLQSHLRKPEACDFILKAFGICAHL